MEVLHSRSDGLEGFVLIKAFLQRWCRIFGQWRALYVEEGRALSGSSNGIKTVCGVLVFGISFVFFGCAFFLL